MKASKGKVLFFALLCIVLYFIIVSLSNYLFFHVYYGLADYEYYSFQNLFFRFLFDAGFDYAIYLISLIIYLCFQTWFLNLIFDDAEDVRRVKFIFSILFIIWNVYNFILAFRDKADSFYACYGMMILSGIVLFINSIKRKEQEVLVMGDNFNVNLKIAREKKGLSQKEVAKGIGVAKSTYSLYESGNREPNVQTIKKIADILDISADELLGINDEPQTIATNFDGDEYTDEELSKIKEFAQFVKSGRK